MAVAIINDSGLVEDGGTPTNIFSTGTAIAFCMLSDTGSSGSTITTHTLNGVNLTQETIMEDSDGNPDLYAIASYLLDNVAASGTYVITLSSSYLNTGTVFVEFSGVDQADVLDGAQQDMTFQEDSSSPPAFTINYSAGDAVCYMQISDTDVTHSAPSALTGGGTFGVIVEDLTELIGGGMDRGSFYIAIADSSQTSVSVQGGFSGETADSGGAIWVVNTAAAAAGGKTASLMLMGVGT